MNILANCSISSFNFYYSELLTVSLSIPHVIKEMLSAAWLTFVQVLPFVSSREISVYKPQNDVLAFNTQCGKFLLLIACFVLFSFYFWLQHPSACNAVLSCQRINEESLSPLAHSCSTTALFLSFTMISFSYNLLASHSLERGILILKIQ